MPRSARVKCESGIYHIMLRGINRFDIFNDEEDYLRFLETIIKIKGDGNFEVYAYCLMSNHVHLVLHEKKEEVSKTMKRIGVSYAWWYNWKYERVGHLFQDRFKSESIDNDSHLLNVVRYVHNNPVKAGMTTRAEEYRWGSTRIYYGKEEYPVGLTNKDFVLEMLSSNRFSAVEALKKYTEEPNQDKFIDYGNKMRKSDEELCAEIRHILNGKPLSLLQSIDCKERNEILRKIKGICGVTQRQIARVTGISQSTISQV